MNLLKKMNKGVALWIVIGVVLVVMIVLEAFAATPEETQIRKLTDEVLAIESEYFVAEKPEALEDYTDFVEKAKESLKPYYASSLIVKNDVLVENAVNGLASYLWYLSTESYFNDIISVEIDKEFFDIIVFNANKTEATRTFYMNVYYKYDGDNIGYISNYCSIDYVKESGSWKMVSPLNEVKSVIYVD